MTGFIAASIRRNCLFLHFAFLYAIGGTATGTSILQPSIAQLIRDNGFIAAVTVEKLEVVRADGSVESNRGAWIGPGTDLSPHFTCRLLNGGLLKGAFEGTDGLVSVQYGEDYVNTVGSLGEGTLGLEFVLFKGSAEAKNGWLFYGLREEVEFQLRVLASSQRPRPKELAEKWVLSSQVKGTVEPLPRRLELSDNGEMVWTSIAGESVAKGTWYIFEEHLVIELEEELVPSPHLEVLRDSIQSWKFRRTEDRLALTTTGTGKEYVFQRSQ